MEKNFGKKSLLLFVSVCSWVCMSDGDNVTWEDEAIKLHGLMNEVFLELMRVGEELGEAPTAEMRIQAEHGVAIKIKDMGEALESLMVHVIYYSTMSEDDLADALSVLEDKFGVDVGEDIIDGEKKIKVL